MSEHDELKAVLKNSKLDFIDALLQILDEEHALLFIKTFSGEQIYVPMYESIEKRIRNKKIVQDYIENHLSIHDLSQKYSMSNRMIRMFIKDYLTSITQKD